MSTLLIALTAVIGYGAVLFSLAYLFDRLQKKESRNLLRRFSALAAEHHLSVTEQEVWDCRVIGVDGQQGKVLFVEDKGPHSGGALIDLSQAKSCRIKKQYGCTPFVEAIALEIEAPNSPYPVSLPFYEHQSPLVRIREAPEREDRVRKWAALLGQLIEKQQPELGRKGAFHPKG